ncbi:MAG: CDP-diacylglycerol--serine O-phosphatidyltransferase [Anaerolineae bacterium]
MPRRLTLVIPSLATFSSLIFGVLAIMVLADGNFLLAAMLILLGSILDVLDGQLAARLNAISDIGKELDSLADMITFGVAPTLLVYHLLLLVGVDQFVAMVISMGFVIGGAYRLARFNTRPGDRGGYFKGLPIPMASALVIAGSFWQHWQVNIWWTVLVISASYLMVSPFPYPKSTRVLSLPGWFWGLMVLLVGISWAIVGWQGVPFGLFLMYAAIGPLLLIFKSTYKRLRRNEE